MRGRFITVGLGRHGEFPLPDAPLPTKPTNGIRQIPFALTRPVFRTLSRIKRVVCRSSHVLGGNRCSRKSSPGNGALLDVRLDVSCPSTPTSRSFRSSLAKAPEADLHGCSNRSMQMS